MIVIYLWRHDGSGHPDEDEVAGLLRPGMTKKAALQQIGRAYRANQGLTEVEKQIAVTHLTELFRRCGVVADPPSEGASNEGKRER